MGRQKGSCSERLQEIKRVLRVKGGFINVFVTFSDFFVKYKTPYRAFYMSQKRH